MTTLLRWANRPSFLIALLICGVLVDIVLIGRHFDLNKSDWAGWVQAIGSIAAVLIAVWVMHWQHARSLERDADIARSQTISLLKAISAEIDLFPRLIRARLDAKGAVWRSRTISFPIYNMSAGQIGLLDDDELRRKIIQIYFRIQDFFATAENYSFEAGKVMLQRPPILEDQKNVERHWDLVIEHGNEVLPALRAIGRMLEDAIAKLEAAARK